MELCLRSRSRRRKLLVQQPHLSNSQVSLNLRSPQALSQAEMRLLRQNLRTKRLLRQPQHRSSFQAFPNPHLNLRHLVSFRTFNNPQTPLPLLSVLLNFLLLFQLVARLLDSLLLAYSTQRNPLRPLRAVLHCLASARPNLLL
jgi:hypothetical protein